MGKADERVGRLLTKLHEHINKSQMVGEDYIEEEYQEQKRVSPEDEIAELRNDIAELKEMVKHMMNNSHVVMEGSSEIVNLFIGEHRFRGKMTPVVAAKK